MPTNKKQTIIVVDLGFGDAGKGTIVDYLTREHDAHTLVRFNGGAQAAHNVVTPDGRHHTFAQFGSGSFVPGVQTYLSRYMLVEPYAMFNEADHLHQLGVTDIFQRTALDRDALIISPYQIAANRLRELARGKERHGSCGLGIGETMSDSLTHPEVVIHAGDLADRHCVVRKLQRLRDLKWAQIKDIVPRVRALNAAQPELYLFEHADLVGDVCDTYVELARRVRLVDQTTLHDVLLQPGCVVFEGAQGVLLDENYGFHPYTTWSTPTFSNALDLLRAADYDGDIKRLGVLRTYFTRHGAGPFVTEDKSINNHLSEQHNATSTWQQHFRLGYFDAVAARYALEVAGGVDALALTHLDYLPKLPEWKLCTGYQYDAAPNDLDGYFTHDDTTITRINFEKSVDLNRQAALTRRLLRCTPQYETLPTNNANDYLDVLKSVLNAPIAITSSGTTALHKTSRLPL